MSVSLRPRFEQRAVAVCCLVSATLPLGSAFGADPDLSGNTSDVVQSTSSATVEDAISRQLSSSIEQSGSDNAATIAQSGFFNHAVIQQASNTSVASIVQTGSGNVARIVQY